MAGPGDPITIQRPRRWDRPFAEKMSPSEVDRILSAPVLRDIDPDQFPPTMALVDLIRNDARINIYRRGDIVVREGDYGSSVFIILSGTIRVLLDSSAGRLARERRSRGKRSWPAALTQQWRNHRAPEVRDVSESVGVRLGLRSSGSEARLFISDLAAAEAGSVSVVLGPGEMFGEIAALSRSPRTATLYAQADSEVIELRWQGLRDIRRRDRGFRELIDGLYRSRNLGHHLRESPLLRHLDDAALETIASRTLFETHGDLEWFGAFKEVLAHDSSGAVEHEPIIAHEGHYLDGLVIIRSGFARVSQQLDHGHRTVGYLTAGEAFGLDELTRHWRGQGELILDRSLRAVGYVDIFRLPTALVEEHVLPALPEGAIERMTAGPASSTRSSRLAPAWSGRGGPEDLEQSVLDALVDSRVINGTATMIIDNDRCVGCDECVLACSTTHDNNPRFVRHGPSHANLMFTNACMHCVDPVCLIGCPTGAIQRSLEGARVLIDDATCIGCGVCADSCPYDNIRMVEIRDADGAFILDSESRQPILRATKCDLCVDQLTGPACAQACPHDALIRVDMRDRRRLGRWVNRVGGARRRLLAVGLAVAGAGMLVALDLIWKRSLGGANLLSGWVLLAAIAVLLGLVLRKRVPGAPLGRATTWLRVHTVVGLIALVVFVAHSGLALPEGLLEAALWTAFVTVSASGLLGMLLNRTLPARIRHRGERIIFERIPAFRRRLAAEVESLAMRSVRETASSTIADYYAHRLHGFFSRPRGLLAHLLDSGKACERMRREIHHLRRYLDPRGNEILDEIEVRLEAKDDLDYQRALQLVLRRWRWVHVPLSSALVLLIMAHVVLALAFSMAGS